MKIIQFIHQMNFSEVNANQSYVRVDKDINLQVENIIPRGIHISFKGKYEGNNLSPNSTAVTWPSDSEQIQTIGTIVSTHNVKPGDLIIFEKKENDDNIYVDCIKRDNVISVLKYKDGYEILNESVLDDFSFPSQVIFDDNKYSFSIKKYGDLEKRKDAKDNGRHKFIITLDDKKFQEVFPNMDDFNIFNVNGQYVVEKNIKNKIVEIEYE